MAESEWPNGRDWCLGCGCELRVDRPSEPCPACGATARDHHAYAGAATVQATANNPGTRAKEPDPNYHGGRLHKPARERTSRFDVTRSDRVERRVTRSIDRLGDEYEETIHDPDGTVFRHVKEPLSKHQGHGSAKPTRT